MIDFAKRLKGTRREVDKGVSIKAWFIRETGFWSEDKGKFINISKSNEFRDISVTICERENGFDKLILKFYGGPTGFESYYLKDVIELIPDKDKINDTQTMCICGGTINRWDACYVNYKEVIDFIESVLGEELYGK